MTGDNDRADLFKGKPGSILGGFREEPPTDTGGAAKAKKKAAEQKRLPPRRARGGRVPPGQEIVTKWPVLDLGHQPLISPREWSLSIKGAVAKPRDFDWDAFMVLPQSNIEADIHCVTAWSMLDNVWGGVSTRDLLAAVAPREDARHVMLHSHDGYRTNVSLARFGAEDALLAHHWNSQPISREHGGPVRLVIPALYFWKSAKWIRQITFLTADVKGYWEALGYHNEGDPWREERYE